MNEKDVLAYCEHLSDKFWTRHREKWAELDDWWSGKTGAPIKICHDGSLMWSHAMARLEYYFKNGIMDCVYDDYYAGGQYRCFMCYKKIGRKFQPTDSRPKCSNFSAMQKHIICSTIEESKYDPTKPDEYIADLFDNFHDKHRDVWREMIKAKREGKEPFPGCVHDFLHLGVDMYRAIRDLRQFGMMSSFYHPDGKFYCCLCGQRGRRTWPCTYIDPHTKYCESTTAAFATKYVCWREVNLIGKARWKNIPATNKLRGKKSPTWSETLPVDTLHKRRKELEELRPEGARAKKKRGGDGEANLRAAPAGD